MTVRFRSMKEPQEVKKQIAKVDSNLPWRSSLEQSQKSIGELEEEMQAAIVVLTDKQRKFVFLILEGNTQRKAYESAGYVLHKTIAVRDTNASELIRKPKVAHALQLARVYHQLKYGISAMWKRQQLVNVYDKCVTEGETWNPTGANKAIQLLMQMDGDIVQGSLASGSSNSGTTIVINTGVPRNYTDKSKVIDVDNPKLSTDDNQ